VEREKKFVSAGVLDGGGELFRSGVFRGGDGGAELAGLSGVEGHAQGGGDAHRARVFRKHLAPSEDLHGVQQRAVGAEPGEEEAGDGEGLPHGWG